MRAQLLSMQLKPIQSFSVRRDQKPTVNNWWHFHPEFELICIIRGTGTLLIEDRAVPFFDGDVFIIGPNQAHYCRFDDAYFIGDNCQQVDVKVVHFKEELFGAKFLNLPENAKLKSLLKQSEKGIKLIGVKGQVVGRMMATVLKSEGGLQLLRLIRILLEIAGEKIEFLTNMEPTVGLAFYQAERWKHIHEYVQQHFKEDIKVCDVASIANLGVSSFCRFFKSLTGQTFTHFVINMRIQEACKLLKESSMNIKQICFESGFRNFTSFHKYFKAIAGKSPLSFRQEAIEPAD